MHLRYCLMTAHDCGETRHAEEVMRELGILYEYATPQSLTDQWWFWNCKVGPMTLPKYLTELNVTPFEAVGYGLTKEMAERIYRGIRRTK